MNANASSRIIAAHHIELPAPEAVPLPYAPAVFGISRSTLYRLAGEGLIRFIKVGKSTLVDAPSVRAFLAAQPSAVIRPDRGGRG